MERIDGCGQFVPVPFSLSKTDPTFGTAPAGYQWLIVNSSGRYGKGVCVEIQLELTGDFPAEAQAIKVLLDNEVATFSCDCFLVPKCNPQGKLAVIKTCGRTIVNNQVTLSYQVNVSNIGNAPLTDVQYLDNIFISPLLGLGTITVDPLPYPSIPARRRDYDQRRLGTINPGGQINVAYNIRRSVTTPRVYLINNTALATAADTQAQFPALRNLMRFKSSSPSAPDEQRQPGFLPEDRFQRWPVSGHRGDMADHLFVPPGLTVSLPALEDARPLLRRRGAVPLNANITGPVNITVGCKGLVIPAGGSISRTITFAIISSTAFGTAAIQNLISSVTPAVPDSQIFLGAGQLPVQANADISLTLSCRQPCP